MRGVRQRRVGHRRHRPPSPPPRPAPPPTTALLVEDHPGLRRSLAAHLEQHGCRVVTARGGLLGLLEFLRRDELDLVILDVQLPDMHGLHLLREIRERCLVVPVVLMTDGTAPVHSAVPHVSVLNKPFGPAQLLAKVREACAWTSS